MSISGFAIGEKVWLVNTERAAQKVAPETLPIGSVILTPEEAIALGEQIQDAGQRAKTRRKERA